MTQKKTRTREFKDGSIWKDDDGYKFIVVDEDRWNVCIVPDTNFHYMTWEDKKSFKRWAKRIHETALPVVKGSVRSDGYRFKAIVMPDGPHVIAGCQNFRTLKAAKEHWSDEHWEIISSSPDTDYYKVRKRLNVWSRKEATRLFAEARAKVKKAA